MGMTAIPAIGAGLGLVSSLISNRPQQYRETPFQQQLGGFMGNLLQQGGTQMPPELFGQMQQAYQMPQSVPWAMGIMPGMFGGGMQPGYGQTPPWAQRQGMPQAGFGMNPFAM